MSLCMKIVLKKFSDGEQALLWGVFVHMFDFVVARLSGVTVITVSSLDVLLMFSHTAPVVCLQSCWLQFFTFQKVFRSLVQV